MKDQESIPIAVFLNRVSGYGDTGLSQALRQILDALLPGDASPERVLVKPNLLAAGNQGLACTHPFIVVQACKHLLDLGHTVLVADSPAFGSARSVARRTGLLTPLASLGVPVMSLDKPVASMLPMGQSVGISSTALEADRILSLPKLKAHCQMRMTGAIKNLFGCISGMRKALAHTLHGDKGNRFPSLILELGQMLPPTVHLLDGITAMHVDGPKGGQPYELGLLAGSASAVALDTAACSILGLGPELVPLWQEARRRELPGSDPKDLHYPDHGPDDFPATGFVLPEHLKDESFNPMRLLKSSLKRIWTRLKG